MTTNVTPPWPQLTIGAVRPKYPLIQGGMAIRISTHRLAAAVAEAGGIGVIAATGMDEDELRREIRAARALTSGPIGVNIMFAVRRFAELAHAALDEGIDLFISGAGFSRDMFAWGRATGTPIVPIVGSAKLGRVSEGLGASAVILEGFEAGGHLGTDRLTQEVLPELRAAVSIPVVAAGGTGTPEGAARAFGMGADGIQVGVLFAASVEANGAPAHKQMYIDATEDDIVLINSPVGLPGRAIRNPFTEALAAGEVEPAAECTGCLKKCSRAFCIRNALNRAQQGDVVTGLVFAGLRVNGIKSVLPARQIILDLMAGAARIMEQHKREGVDRVG